MAAPRRRYVAFPKKKALDLSALTCVSFDWPRVLPADLKRFHPWAPNRVIRMQLLRWCLLVGAIVLVATKPARAQGPADRVFLDSLVRRLAEVTTTTLPPESACTGRSADLARLCLGLIVGRRGSLTANADDARRADDLLIRSVNDHSDWPAAWFGLGINRLALARLKVFSHEGPLLGTGLSNEAGGANALAQALKLDPAFEAAANSLAFTPMPREGSSVLKERVALLRQVRSLLSPEASAMTAAFEREAGNIDSAIALQRRALASGKVDSGVVQLDLARNLYRIGQPSKGHAALIRGAAATSRASIAAYRADLSWVASPKELAEWDSLSSAERSGWVAAFWARRDVAEGRQDGERLVEHYRRIEYALVHYRIQLPQNGRQKALSVTYPLDYYVEYQARDAAALGKGIAASSPVFMAMMQTSRFRGGDAVTRYYKPIQDQIDDRGIAYIRQGPPTITARTTGGEALEIWRYDRSDGPLILQFRETDFDGRMDATVMVTSLLSAPVPLRNQICHIDMTICPASNRFQALGGSVQSALGGLEKETIYEGSRLSPEAIIKSAERGKHFIDVATTTDAFPREFTHKLEPSVQIFGLDRATGGDPRLVVAFAIPGDQLAHTTPSGGDSRAIYPVRLQLMAARERDGVRMDLDTLRQFATPAPLTNRQYLTGIIELPAPPGSYDVSLVVTQADGRGAVAHLGSVAVPGSGPRLSMSDLVLGREGSGTRWNSGATVVPLNPLNAWSVSAGAEVYFQLSGLVTGESYVTKYEFFLSTDGPKRGPRLTISGSQVATQSRLEVTRTLGLQNLPPGRYRVHVTTTGGGRSVTATAWMTIVK
jgi:hypothetical protein